MSAPIGRRTTSNLVINILIADEHAIMCAGLKQLLAATTDIVVAGEAAQGSEVINKVRTCRVDLLLLDMRMPGVCGDNLILRVRTE